METNSIDFQLQAEDYLSANYLHMRWGRYWVVPVVGVLAFELARFAYSGSALLVSDVQSTILPYGIFIATLLGLRYVYTPWRTRRTFGQQKSLHRPQHFSWDEARLDVQGAGFSAQTPWSDYLRWRENKRVFLLYVTDTMFRIVPKRAFVDEESIAEFREVLCRRIAPKDGQRRKNSE